jgi:hypothetical protein
MRHTGTSREARAIGQFGFVQPVVARLDGTLIDGHERHVVARRLGARARAATGSADRIRDLGRLGGSRANR